MEIGFPRAGGTTILIAPFTVETHQAQALLTIEPDSFSTSSPLFANSSLLVSVEVVDKDQAAAGVSLPQPELLLSDLIKIIVPGESIHSVIKKQTLMTWPRP